MSVVTGNALTDRHAAFLELARERRSVREFLPDAVPPEIVSAAIEAAGWAPSPHGRQPWRFAVVEGTDAKSRLADDMAAAWREQLALDGQDRAVIELRLEKSQRRVRTAPVLIIPCLYLDDLDIYPDMERQQAEETMAVQSLGAAVQNLLLSVYAAGYSAGWMCAPLFCPDVVRASLGLGSTLDPHALIPIGRIAKEPARRPRRPVDELVAAWITDER